MASKNNITKEEYVRLLREKYLKHDESLLEIANELLQYEKTSSNKEVKKNTEVTTNLNINKLRESQLQRQQLVNKQLILDEKKEIEEKKRRIAMQKEHELKKKKQMEQYAKSEQQKKQAKESIARKASTQNINEQKKQNPMIMVKPTVANQQNSGSLEHTQKISYTLQMDLLNPKLIEKHRKLRSENISLSIENKFVDLDPRITKIYFATTVILTVITSSLIAVLLQNQQPF